jgi:NAD(P)-dependent dehydrogenase (short-subunit alcohol dehydrogenase family)
MSTQHPALAPGNVAVVTGAASGIGLAAALRFLDLGLRVCLADRDEARLASAIAGRASADVMTYALDVSDRPAVDGLAATVAEHQSRPC